jgi:hypothetical protein
MNPAGDNSQKTGNPVQKIATNNTMSFSSEGFLLINANTYKYAKELREKNNHLVSSTVILANNPVIITIELNTKISNRVSLSNLLI